MYRYPVAWAGIRWYGAQFGGGVSVNPMRREQMLAVGGLPGRAVGNDRGNA